MERTRDGFERTRWYQGEVVGEERIMSDQLLMFMIDRTDPLRHGNGFGAQRLRPAAISATAIAPPRDAAVNASPRDTPVNASPHDAAEPRDASGLATRC